MEAVRTRGWLAKFGDGLAWLLGGALISVGALGLWSTVAGGPPLAATSVAFLLAGSLVLPPVIGAIRKRTGRLQPAWQHVVAVLALLFGLNAGLSLVTGGTAALQRWSIAHPAPPSPPHPVQPSTLGGGNTSNGSHQSSKAPPPKEPEPPAKPTRWRYSQSSDPMRGETTDYAEVTSDNELDFAFPYAGGSSGILMLRRRSRLTDVMLKIDKGQFICNPITGARIEARFDEGPIRRLRCSEPRDGSANLLFLAPEAALVAELRAAHRLTIEAEFYREGSQQLNFTVEGLKW